MKKMFTLFLLSFISCDYSTDQKVLVIDKNSNLPIEKANVSFGPYELITNKLGYCAISEFGTGNLLERTIVVSRHGYENFEISLKINDGDYISYKQKRDSSSYHPTTSFAVLQDTLVVYMKPNYPTSASVK